MRQADYIGFLLNCPTSGDDWTVLSTGARVRNKISLTLGRQKVTLIQDHRLVGFGAPDIWGQQVHTTDLIVHGVTSKSFPRVQRMHRRLAELLMFATQSEVRACGYNCDAVEPSGRVSAMVGVAVHSLPIIDTHHPGALRDFLERVWRLYLRERRRRRLHVAFEYSVLSQKPGQPIETKLVITLILFECLKHSYAALRGYPFIKGRFRELGASVARPGRPLSFRRLVGEMLNAAGLRPRLDTLVRVRNELIHSGMASGSFKEHRRLYERLQDLARIYLLRILDYHGPHLKFAHRTLIRRRKTPKGPP